MSMLTMYGITFSNVDNVISLPKMNAFVNESAKGKTR